MPTLFCKFRVLQMLTSLTFLSTPAWALYTTGESGEVIPEGSYALGVEPQIVVTSPSGLNLSVLGDYPLTKDSSLRAHIGSGQTTFDLGASYKWIPIPDYNNQPAFGVKVEADTNSANGITANAIRVHPLISKKLDRAEGLFTPYAALPISLVSATGSSYTGLQVVGGSEFQNQSLPKWKFAAELGLNLTNSVSYISGVVTYLFDLPTSGPTVKTRKR